MTDWKQAHDDLRAAVEALRDVYQHRHRDLRQLDLSTTDVLTDLNALLATPAPEAAREEVPLRLAQHLAHILVDEYRCEVADDEGGRCRGPAVGVRWEARFADAVCEHHAETARARGAFVVLAKRHDGTDDTPAPDLPTTVQADGWDQGHMEDCKRFPTGWLCNPTCPAPSRGEVQADRDAGQVRLAEDGWAEAERWRSAFTQAGIDANDWAERAEAAEAALAARQSDPDATERVEWGVRDASGYVDPWRSEKNARIRAAGDDRTLVRRTVTTGEWTEVEG